MKILRLTLLLLSCGIAGCTVGPDYHRPEVSLPENWSTSLPDASQATSDPNMATVDLAHWWMAFNDPQLNNIIDNLTRTNLDLQKATARIREARALYGISRAGRWPTLNSQAAFQRSGPSENTFEAQNTPFPTDDRDLFQAGFDATWELDLFGGVRRLTEAATADLQAAYEQRSEILVTLTAEAARHYIEIRSLQQRLDIARKNIDTQTRLVELTRRRFQNGLIGELELNQALTLLATTQARIPLLQAGLSQSLHRLAVLTADPPDAWTTKLSESQALPALIPSIPLALPSELLRRRPDIRRAERQLAAAHARIGVATADLFPRFSLNGTVGLQSQHFSELFQSASTAYTVGPSLRWPIFAGGRIRQTIEVQDARTQQALLNYRQIILVSLEEVENALAAYDRELERYTALSRAVSFNQRSVILANNLFEKGLASFIQVLDAERSLYDVEDQLAQSSQTLQLDLIALFKALGGGWEDNTPQTTALNMNSSPQPVKEENRP